MKNKKGYYLVIDSLIAIAILSIGIFLIRGSLANSPSHIQGENLAHDTLSFLASAKVSDFCDFELSICWGPLTNLEIPKNRNNSLLGYIGELKKNGRQGSITDLIENSVANSHILNQNFNFTFMLDGSLFYPRGITKPEDINGYKSSPLVSSSSRIIFGHYDDQLPSDPFIQFENWGPYTAEARVWAK